MSQQICEMNSIIIPDILLIIKTDAQSNLSEVPQLIGEI